MTQTQNQVVRDLQAARLERAAKTVKTVTSFEEAWIQRNPALWRERSFAVVENARNHGLNLRMVKEHGTYHFIAWDTAESDGRLEL